MHHQGVVAEADTFKYSHLDDLLQTEAPLLLALDSLQDPQNFGTLLRTAQAVQVDGVLLPEHRAVTVTPAVSNASAGAVEHLRVARVTNLARTLRDLKRHRIWIYGLSLQADDPYWSVDFRGGTVLVVGSEGPGLGRLVAETCDALVRIPMAPGSVQSLNASVAGSLVLYEAFRQRSTLRRE
jgi:23S rRNA (guanosine2251-2'-O)-methyltransferase